MRLFVSPPSWTTRKKRGTAPRSSIDLAAFLSVILALVFIVMFGNMYPPDSHSIPVDMPVTENSALETGPQRDESLIVFVTRDGSVYFRNARLSPRDLPDAIREAASEGGEKTVYVKADARAKYGDVKLVLDQIRLSGLQNITFLTEHPNH